MSLFYQYSILYLIYVVFRLFKKTGQTNFTVPTNIVELQEQSEIATKMIESNSKNRIIGIFRILNFCWIVIGIFVTDYKFIFASILFACIMNLVTKFVEDRNERRLSYFIADFCIIFFTSIIVFHEVIVNYT